MRQGRRQRWINSQTFCQTVISTNFINSIEIFEKMCFLVVFAIIITMTMKHRYNLCIQLPLLCCSSFSIFGIVCSKKISSFTIPSPNERYTHWQFFLHGTFTLVYSVWMVKMLAVKIVIVWSFSQRKKTTSMDEMWNSHSKWLSTWNKNWTKTKDIFRVWMFVSHKSKMTFEYNLC